MATVSLAPFIRQKYFSGSTALAGGKLYTYQAGTSTPQATYTDSTGATPNANPVILDANGEARIWLDISLSYKFVLKDSSDVTQWTEDNVIGLLTNNSVNTAAIQDLAITTAKIADNGVTSAKLASDAAVDANRAVQTNHIQNAAITSAKLDGTTTASAKDIWNASLACSVATNALTIALKDKSGANPTAASPVKIGMRNVSATAGDFNIRSVTAALSLVVPSGATLGMANAISGYLWVYALDNAGTVELAVSSTWYDDGTIQNTTAISSGSTNNAIIYSTAGRTGVPIRVLGRIKISEATAGTWASSPLEVVCGNEIAPNRVYVMYNSGTNQQTVATGGNADLTAYSIKVTDSHNAFNSSPGVFVAPRNDYYTVLVGAQFGVNVTGSRILYIVGPYFTITADYQVGSSTIPIQLKGGNTFYMAKGDTLKCQVFQNSGGALATSNDATGTYISIVSQGAAIA